MARKIIDIGIVGNDGTGDSIRDSFRKVNDNFRELYSSLGLGERLTFLGLSDTPNTYLEAIDNLRSPNATAVLTVNNTQDGLTFKQIVGGEGISVDFDNQLDGITIKNDFTRMVQDTSPVLGGNLRAKSGDAQYRILDLPIYNRNAAPGLTGGPESSSEAVSKSYVDAFISRAGVDHIDPAIGQRNSAFGRMTGPLILARNPESDDDELYGGLVAATKRYVDNSTFGSANNLYVSLSGQDENPAIDPRLQGSSLAYSYRTIEAALKRAEEMMLESRVELGPYKKTLTYNSRQETATLDAIVESPDSGSGFEAQALMSIDSIQLNQPGANYWPNDIIEIIGGTGSRARIQVLATTSNPGSISTFKVLSTGVYTVLPGATNVQTELTETGAPAGIDGVGVGASFDLTYKINNVQILNPGSGYGLVSVRITGGGGSGAFGTADVVNGAIVGITITDTGSGFSSLPTVIANLPRFCINTNGYRTDSTGNVILNTAEAIRSRDLREGIYLRGETSGALAQILKHDGSLGNAVGIPAINQAAPVSEHQLNGDIYELFDMDIKFGSFIEGEVISFGDITRNLQISVLIESGVYEENLPLRIPPNVAVIGDEFRRVIIKPRPGISTSPWVFQKFRRDTTVGWLSKTFFEIAEVEIVDQGIGYSVDDILTIEYGNFTNSAKIKVTEVDGDGKIVDFNLLFGGVYLDSPNLGIPVLASDGSGSLASFKVIDIIPRSIENDLLTIGDRLFGYHYLTDSSRPIIPKIQNKGSYDAAATLISLNKSFIQAEVIAWINYQIENNITPFTENFVYDRDLCRRDVGLIVNALIFDLKQGGYNRTISAGLKYQQNSSSLIAVTSQLEQTLAAINHINELVQPILSNIEITPVRQSNLLQIIDPAYISETGSSDAANLLSDVLQDVIRSFESVNNPNVTNPGGFSNSAELIKLNKSFIQSEVIAWINNQIINNITPFTSSFVYDDSICYRDVGLIIDSMIFDLEKGGSNSSISAAQKYQQNSSALIAITDQLEQTVAAISYIDTLAQSIILNSPIDAYQLSAPQVINTNYTAELGSELAISDLVQAIINVIQNFRINIPKNNDQIDVFLCNDANIVRACSSQGHGGFMMVLDPTGQILAKSPYAQESSSFSKSINTQTFAGGQFVDGFCGNLQFKHTDSVYTVNSVEIFDGGQNYQINDLLTISNGDPVAAATLRVTSTVGGVITGVSIVNAGNYSSEISGVVSTTGGSGSGAEFELNFSDPTRISVTGLDRFPNLPSSMLINDEVYRINYVRDFVYDKDGSSATLVLDETTPFRFPAGSQICTFQLAEPGDFDSPLVVNKSEHKLQRGSTVVFAGSSLPAGLIEEKEYYVILEGLNENQFRISSEPNSNIPVRVTSLGSGVQSYERIYELLTPGNRSMLSNDYTQVNDLGYGLVATNGGLIEAVSVFTYYCHISYYSINGGQIRSVGGSSAHGNYALVAQGSDPLELPTPISVYEELSQGVECYFPDDDYKNDEGSFQIWVTNYSYQPIGNSELEIDHDGEIIRYEVGLVTRSDTDPQGVVKLSIAGEEGLTAQVPDGTKMTLRADTRIVLSGNVLNVPVRPSTGLLLNELPRKVYRVLEFQSYDDPNGPYECNISDDNGVLVISTLTPHKQKPNYLVSFSVENPITDDLPEPLEPITIYYVLETDFTETSFKISTSRNGNPIESGAAGTGTFYFMPAGLATAKLRENYQYILVTPKEPNEFYVDGFGSDIKFSCTIEDTLGNDFVITTSAPHGFDDGTVIKFDTEDTLPQGLSLRNHYFVRDSSPTTFKVSVNPNGSAAKSLGPSLGTFYVGKVKGNIGDDSFLVNPIGTEDIVRIEGTKFVFKGEEYTIVQYENPGDIGDATAGRITLDRPLVDSVIYYSGQVTLKAGSAARESNSSGTLTVRISLTRVTGHDLLDIGTGSYADTNYPNEIYGPPVNSANPSKEVQERDVGRIFYVTTDQFGNVSIGPFFKVDQGTGNITIAAPIAVSNLSGLGFKRGVTITEFSVDDTFNDGSPEKVPTEFAARRYIERRLGITHNGELLDNASESNALNLLIPPIIGGFLPLNGTLRMKGDINMQDGANVPNLYHKIVNLGNPTNPRDAVNLQSLTIDNVTGLVITDPVINQLAVFTGNLGSGNDIIVNATVIGDVTFTGLASDSIISTIGADKITNSMIKSAAGIEQTKLQLDNSYSTIASSIVVISAVRSSTTATLTFANQTSAPFSPGQKITVDGFTTLGYNGVFTVLSCTPTNLTYSVSDTLTSPATGTGTIKPFNGISSFDARQFTVTDGFVTIRDNGVALSKLPNISNNNVLGNTSGNTGAVQSIPFSTIVDVGGAVMESDYTSTGFYRATVSGTTRTFSIVDSSSGSSLDVGGGRLILRDVNGDFGGRIADIQELKIRGNTAIKREASSASVGNVQYIGYNSNTGIVFSSGTSGNVAQYNSARHDFKNGNNYAPIYSSLLETTTIQASGGAVTSSGQIRGRWILDGTSRFEATYAADLAEYYEGDANYEVGTVLIFGGEKEVTISNQLRDTRVAGVVSDSAAYVMYDACPGMKNLVALQGRVPCKIVGRIVKGDLIVSSSIPGVATSAGNSATSGTIIGKALENYDSVDVGMIQVAVGRS